MFKSIFFFLSLLLILSGCSFNINGNKTIAIGLLYAQIDANQDIRNLDLQQLEFSPYQQQKIDFDNKNKNVVFKFNIDQLDSANYLNKELVIVVDHKYLHDVSYLTQYDYDNFSKPEQQFRLQPTDNRIFSSEKFVFNFNNKPHSNHFIVIHNNFNTSVAISLVEKDEYIKHDNKIVIFFTLLYSAMFGMFLIIFTCA